MTAQSIHQKAQAILKQHRVGGLLSYSYQYYPPSQTRKGRYQITTVERNNSAIESVSRTFGWRVYVTNAPTSRLSFEDAVLTYRDEWIAERGFHRFKGKSLSITPFKVQRDDYLKGLVHLLSLGLRLLTLIEFVVRRQLEQSGSLWWDCIQKIPRRQASDRPLRGY